MNAFTGAVPQDTVAQLPSMSLHYLCPLSSSRPVMGAVPQDTVAQLPQHIIALPMSVEQ